MAPPDRPPPESEDAAPIVEIAEELSAGMSDALDQRDDRKRERELGWILGKIQEHSTSLKQGLQTFAEHRQEFRNIQEKMAARPSRLPLIAMLITLGLALVGALWQAARYPDRGEFNTTRQALEQRTQDLTLQSTLQQRDISDLREANKRLEGIAAALQSKIDQLLLHQTGTRP